MRTIAALALVLSSASCWVEPIARQHKPPPYYRPDSADGEGEGGTGGDPGAAVQHDPVIPEIGETIQNPAYTPPPMTVALLPGNLRAVTRPFGGRTGGDAAFVRLTLAHRLRPDAQLGLAMLTADLVARSPGGAEGRASLESSVERIGGQLDMHVDGTTTSFEIRVPSKHWRDALAHLAEALRTTPASRSQTRRAQQRLERELRESLENHPMPAAVDRVLGHRFEGVNRLMTEVQDLTTTQVSLFHRRSYRPSAAVLALLVPRGDEDQLLAGAAAALEPWTSSETAAKPEPFKGWPRPTGIHWAPGPNRAHFAALYPMADPTGSLGASALVALQLLTWDGAGGRLGDRLARQYSTEVGLRDRVVPFGTDRYLQLSAPAQPQQVAEFYRVSQLAARSLSTDPPNAREIEIAAARARLLLIHEIETPQLWLGMATRIVLKGAAPNARVAEGEVERTEIEADPVAETFEALQDPQKIDITGPARELAERLPVVIVLGGEIDRDAAGVVEMRDAFLKPARTADPSAPQGGDERATQALLKAALDAVGGRPNLASMRGGSSVAETRSGAGPRAEVRSWFRAGQKLRRVRRVLASTIETVVDTDGGIERSGERQMAVSAEVARSMLNAALRHPLYLLAAYARGESSYRLIDVRADGDRKLAVLERVGDGDRLRMFIDQESGLVRAIEYEERGEIGVVNLREEYRDYRRTGRVRVPFHRTTYVDETIEGRVTEWREFKAQTPTDEELTLGGPVK